MKGKERKDVDYWTYLHNKITRLIALGKIKNILKKWKAESKPLPSSQELLSPPISYASFPMKEKKTQKSVPLHQIEQQI